MEAGIEADDVRRRERTCGVCAENAGAKSKQFHIHCFPLNLPCVLMHALDMRHGGGSQREVSKNLPLIAAVKQMPKLETAV